MSKDWLFITDKNRNNINAMDGWMGNKIYMFLQRNIFVSKKEWHTDTCYSTAELLNLILTGMDQTQVLWEVPTMDHR